MQGIIIGGHCPPADAARHRAMLSTTPVWPIAEAAVGWLDVDVLAPEGLRVLPTLWCELRGTHRPGGGPWLVGEVADSIVAGRCPDPKIEAYVRTKLAELRAGTLPLPRLFLIRREVGFQLADGNHRAVALVLEGGLLRLPSVLVELPAGFPRPAC